MQFSSSKQGFTARIQRLFAPATQPRRPRLAGLMALVLIASLAILPQFSTNAAVPNHPELQAAISEPVVIEIDHRWTRAQLSGLQTKMAREGIFLRFSHIETDASGQLTGLAGNVELSDGSEGSFSVSELKRMRIEIDGARSFTIITDASAMDDPAAPPTAKEESQEEEAVDGVVVVNPPTQRLDSPEVKIIRFTGHDKASDSSLNHRFFFVSPDSAAVSAEGESKVIFFTPDIDADVVLDGKGPTEVRIKGIRGDSAQQVEVIKYGLDQSKQGKVYMISPPQPEAKGSGGFFIQENEENGLHPVYYLNGSKVELEKLRKIDPALIGHVEVLKGEKATDAYGQEAEGGVIRIYLKDEAKQLRERLGEGEGAVMLRPDAQTKTEIRISGPRNEEPLIFIDDKPVSKQEMGRLDPDKIDRVEVIKPKKKGEQPQIKVFTKRPVATEIPEMPFQVKAFPNPATDLVQVEVRLETAQPLRVEIYDLQGRLIETLTDKQTSAGPHLYPWKVKNAPAGTYFIRTFAGEQSRTDKVVIE